MDILLVLGQVGVSILITSGIVIIGIVVVGCFCSWYVNRK